MNKLFCFVLLFVAVVSCHRINEVRRTKKYLGEWNLVHKVVVGYNENHEEVYKYETDTTGKLLFNKDGSFVNESIDYFLNPDGKFTLFYEGKTPVIHFEVANGYYPAMVELIKKDELILYFVEGNGTGKVNAQYKYIYEK